MFPNHDGQASDQRLSHEALYARYDAHTDEVSSGSSDQGILAQPSTLSFVFETGSGTRNGGRSVRSQAAKHGWSSRQRAAPNRQDGKRKRRKVKPGPISEGAPSQQSDAIHGFIVHTLSEDTPTLPSSYSDKGGLDPLSLPPDSSIVSEILNGLGLSNLPVPPPSTPREMRPLQPYALVARDNLSKCLPALATSTPSFLQAVLNVECPLYSRIDSIGSPFEGLPVVWDPLYTVLATRYRETAIQQAAQINSNCIHTLRMFDTPLRIAIAEKEPALFFAIMSRVAMKLKQGGAHLKKSPGWFQRKTVEFLNAALADPNRRYSSPIILTVNLISAIETLSGNREAVVTLHRPALKRMVNWRGGLEGLFASGAEGPMFVNFLIWLDRVMASVSDTPFLFPDDDVVVMTTKWREIWSVMYRNLKGTPTALCPV